MNGVYEVHEGEPDVYKKRKKQRKYEEVKQIAKTKTFTKYFKYGRRRWGEAAKQAAFFTTTTNRAITYIYLSTASNLYLADKCAQLGGNPSLSGQNGLGYGCDGRGSC